MQPFNRADSFYGFVSRLFSLLTPPVAGAFWSRLAAVTMVCADRTRRLYTGDGQTYNLYILYYTTFSFCTRLVAARDRLPASIVLLLALAAEISIRAYSCLTGDRLLAGYVARTRTLPPGGVNLIALSIRFSST